MPMRRLLPLASPCEWSGCLQTWVGVDGPWHCAHLLLPCPYVPDYQTTSHHNVHTEGMSTAWAAAVCCAGYGKRKEAQVMVKKGLATKVDGSRLKVCAEPAAACCSLSDTHGTYIIFGQHTTIPLTCPRQATPPK